MGDEEARKKRKVKASGVEPVAKIVKIQSVVNCEPSVVGSCPSTPSPMVPPFCVVRTSEVASACTPSTLFPRSFPCIERYRAVLMSEVSYYYSKAPAKTGEFVAVKAEKSVSKVVKIKSAVNCAPSVVGSCPSTPSPMFIVDRTSEVAAACTPSTSSPRSFPCIERYRAVLMSEVSYYYCKASAKVDKIVDQG
jgi:hypothetical protein